MLQCPSCSGALATATRFCPDCGKSLDVSDTPTGTAPKGGARTPASGPRPVTPTSRAGRLASGVAGEGRFVPGTVVADRYRIVGLLGKGGMGEVYRADDLTLGQAVALKFLPEALKHDSSRLERFLNEVRVARQISHPAVCRVHDIGEVDGHRFLSMEYVDGEDMASLLRRIGRLSKDKALEIARQLCAGIAAAHDRNVLHRDLKPENVMLDGRGKVRITDFGLAGLADAISGDDVRSGTPAYMSPEQLEGREVTPRSDIYALGLLLYELFTGKKAYDGKTLAELTRQRQGGSPASPSTLVEDLDLGIERAILRCLHNDPRERPPSALAVAAALPGGDPLAAALAAGETPSPAQVAAAGECEGMSARSAWACLVTAFAAILLVPILSGRVEVFRQIPMEKSPAVLEDRARDLLQRLGYAEPPADTAVGFAVDYDYLQHVSISDRSPRRWDGLRSGQPPLVQFWYRQSPQPLVATNAGGRVWWNDPPALVSGMSSVRLDTRGHLVQLEIVPPQVEGGPATAPAVDWTPLFAEARLDPARLRPVDPRWTPPFYSDARAAWDGVYPNRPEIPIHVEAAAYRGKPVHFRIVAPWTRPERMQVFQWSGSRRLGVAFTAILFLSLVVGSALVAKRHVHQGRGDRPGALRLAVYIFAAMMVQWALGAHHVPDFRGEMSIVVHGLGLALVVALLVWTLYLALEPYVRRRWPHTIISWTRLLGGGVGDPLVGRDVLIGVTYASALALSGQLADLLVRFLGQPTTPSWEYQLDALLGLRAVAADVAGGQIVPVALAMGLLLLLLLLRLLLRREWLAGAVLVSLLTLQHALFSDVALWASLPLNFVYLAVPVAILLRFGLLPCVVGYYVVDLLLNLPTTSDLSAWTATPTIVVALVVGGLAVYGFRAALGGPQRA